jgi:hypothetical protein
VAEHLVGCAACRSRGTALARLDRAWRAQPSPEDMEPARVRFLGRLRRQPAPPHRGAALRWAAAAALLFGVGLAGWLLMPAPRAQAQSAPALIERLIDWNLELAQAPSRNERGQRYAARQADLRAAVRQTPLSDADRGLADLLLENGSWLAENDDPAGAAERFSAVADRLVERLESAGDRKDHKLALRYARLQALVASHGVAANLDKMKASGALDFEHRGRLEKLILQDSERMQALVELLERHPDLSRKEIREALKIPPKAAKNSAKNSAVKSKKDPGKPRKQLP